MTAYEKAKADYERELFRDSVLIAAHLAAGNDTGAAEILRTTVSDYIASEIDRRTHETGATKLETVQHMLTVYEVPRSAPAMPWRKVA